MYFLKLRHNNKMANWMAEDICLNGFLSPSLPWFIWLIVKANILQTNSLISYIFVLHNSNPSLTDRYCSSMRIFNASIWIGSSIFSSLQFPVLLYNYISIFGENSTLKVKKLRKYYEQQREFPFLGVFFHFFLSLDQLSVEFNGNTHTQNVK